MNSNEKLFNYKVYFGHFFIWQSDNNVVHKIYISYISHISFMKVEERYIRFVNNVTTTMSDEQITKINFVDLEKLWNFVVDNILIWNHLVMQKRRLNLKILKFEFFKRPPDEKTF